jgi:hypothetical protein
MSAQSVCSPAIFQANQLRPGGISSGPMDSRRIAPECLSIFDGDI